MSRCLFQFALCFLLGGSTCAHAQAALAKPPEPLDPTQGMQDAAAATHLPLPEQYIWTQGEVTALRPDRSHYPWNNPALRTTPQRFRAHFQVKSLPVVATLYLAGPRAAHVFVNGKLVADFASDIDAPMGLHVYHVALDGTLHRGDNLLAVEAVRGRGIVSGSGPVATQQLAYGEVLAAKVLPASFGGDAPPMLLSNTAWRAEAASGADSGWTQATFDDSSWPTVESLGPVESNADFFQWSADAGMYAWPGYMGMSPALRTAAFHPVAVTHDFPGPSAYQHLEALTTDTSSALFTVLNPRSEVQTDAEAPSLLLDFGREISGRLYVESASDKTVVLSIAYGESELEALATGLTPGQQGGNYLGTNIMEVPPHGIARGPKSGFRYVRIRFLRGAPAEQFKALGAEIIYYPVKHGGSFHSSDALLNRIWATGAYTAHLCMQDGIWDAVKRDRGRWVGDLDIEGRVIGNAFGESMLLEQTLQALAPEGEGPVNGIPGYSALWITTLENLFQQTGDRTFLTSQREALLHVLTSMDASLDERGMVREDTHHWMFVDWSPGLYAFTPAARLGTQLQYVRGYQAAVLLFSALGDALHAERYKQQAGRTLAAAEAMRDPDKATYGTTWQLNTLAVLTEPPAEGEDIWRAVLSHVKQDAATDPVISPYFNAYVLDAMAKLGHKREALDWMRAYWGGMLAEGATSFWESYDLRWPKGNSHLSLQADGTSGFFVSLAHGWSSGPTAWLSENVLGITPASPGYDTVDIRPDLLGLGFVEGAVPTPHGLITLRLDQEHGLTFTLPEGVREANVSLPVSFFASGPTAVLLDGKPLVASGVVNGLVSVQVHTPGPHTIRSR